MSAKKKKNPFTPLSPYRNFSQDFNIYIGKKKKKGGGIMLPDFSLHYKAIINKTVSY